MPQGDLGPHRETVARSVVFEHLAPAELDLVVAHCRLVEVERGRTVLVEGRHGDGLYIILEGQMEFFLPQRDDPQVKRPSRMRLNVLGPGRCFGEYGIIDHRPCSASAQALEPTRLCFLRREDFQRIVEQHDRLGRIVFANLLRFLVTRLRQKDEELDLTLLVSAPAGAPGEDPHPSLRKP